MEIIQSGSKEAESIGFIEKLFDGEMYIDRKNRFVIITIITSLYPGKRNFSRLLTRLFEEGFDYIQVWNPYRVMKEILSHKGFKQLKLNYAAIDIWEKRHESFSKQMDNRTGAYLLKRPRKLQRSKAHLPQTK
jgi:hypothetical protein